MLFHIPRFRFGPQPAAQDDKALPGRAPPPLSVKDTVRRVAMFREAAPVLDHLPEPGEAVHFLLTGRYDLIALLTVIIERQPVPCDHLRIGTLSPKQRNVYELLRLLDTGKVGRLTLLVSDFFRGHHTGVCASLIQELSARSSRHHFAAARSHAKVVTPDHGQAGKMVLGGPPICGATAI
jgi:hypothetical protein